MADKLTLTPDRWAISCLSNLRFSGIKLHDLANMPDEVKAIVEEMPENYEEPRGNSASEYEVTCWLLDEMNSDQKKPYSVVARAVSTQNAGLFTRVFDLFGEIAKGGAPSERAGWPYKGSKITLQVPYRPYIREHLYLLVEAAYLGEHLGSLAEAEEVIKMFIDKTQMNWTEVFYPLGDDKSSPGCKMFNLEMFDLVKWVLSKQDGIAFADYYLCCWLEGGKVPDLRAIGLPAAIPLSNWIVTQINNRRKFHVKE